MADQHKYFNFFMTGLGTVATLLLAYNTYKVSQFDADLRAVESEREMNFRIYQSIADAVESGNPQRIRAVRTLVTALSTEELRDGFLSALETGEVQIFESDEAVAQRVRTDQPTFDWEDWDYDVFWCSRSGAPAEAQAQAIVDALRAENARGRLRARVLPQPVRTSSAYASLEAYEIRHEANEADQAAAIKRLGDRTLGLEAGFQLKQITPTRPTPWYVSVFVCPELERSP